MSQSSGLEFGRANFEIERGFERSRSREGSASAAGIGRVVGRGLPCVCLAQRHCGKRAPTASTTSHAENKHRDIAA